MCAISRIRALSSEPICGRPGPRCLDFHVHQARKPWRVSQVAVKSGDPILAKDNQPSAHCPDRISALAMAQFGAELGEPKVQFARIDGLMTR